MASTSVSKSKEERREQKALEEARKAGTVPPVTDEDGKDINPHIPSFIAQAPWYLHKEGPSLKHQRNQPKTDYDKTWYDRGAKGQQATKFRKGACTNCGAMTHKSKDCCERPRKVGAKWTGKDISPDEVVQDLKLDYDGQRDRWNGYDSSNHVKMQEDFEKAEQERRKKKKNEVLNKFSTEADDDYARYPSGGAQGDAKKVDSLVDSDDESDSDNDEEKRDYIDQGDQVNVEIKKDPKTRTNIRNLRIREDTAKYLKDLGTDSAHYDPKSRSLRIIDPQAQQGEFTRSIVGDAAKFGEMQRYAWDAYEKGQDIHLVAAPSQAALAFQDFKQKKDTLTKEQKDAILAKYGGKEHLEAPPKELLLAQTEQFVTYAPDGSIIRGKEKMVPRSRYEEDVYINNHNQIWGSFYDNGQWGYACCHQLVKNSYCTGKSGIEVKSRIEQEMRERTEQKTLLEQHQEKPQEAKQTLPQKEERERIRKIEKALQEEEQKAKKGEEKDERRRAFNSLSADSFNATEEEMEAYRLKRQRSDDPMANFLNK